MRDDDVIDVPGGAVEGDGDGISIPPLAAQLCVVGLVVGVLASDSTWAIVGGLAGLALGWGAHHLRT